MWQSYDVKDQNAHKIPLFNNISIFHFCSNFTCAHKTDRAVEHSSLTSIPS